MEQNLVFSKYSTPISVLIAGVFIAGAVLWNAAHPNQQTTGNLTGGSPPAAVADIAKVHITGEPFIGKADAPVTIAYWLDYQCPFCKQNEETALPALITEYVDTGIVKVVFKDFQFLGPDSQSLGIVARAVWEAAPSQFYAWHKAIYDNQGTENTGWATPEKIRSLTESVLGRATTDKVLALATKNSASYQKEMDADRTEGSGFGVTGTPSFIIGKQIIIGAVPYAQLKAAVEAARNAR